MEPINIIKSKLSNMPITDDQMTLAVEEVSQTIKNYCNIDEIPKELNFTLANMAIDLLRYELAMNNATSGTEPTGGSINVGDISNLKIGDTSINLGNTNSVNSKALNSHVAKLDELVLDYKTQLHQFRRMRW